MVIVESKEIYWFQLQGFPQGQRFDLFCIRVGFLAYCNLSEIAQFFFGSSSLFACLTNQFSHFIRRQWRILSNLKISSLISNSITIWHFFIQMTTIQEALTPFLIHLFHLVDVLGSSFRYFYFWKNHFESSNKLSVSFFRHSWEFHGKSY